MKAFGETVALCPSCDKPETDRDGDRHRCFKFTCVYCKQATDNSDGLCDACDQENVNEPEGRPWCGFCDGPYAFNATAGNFHSLACASRPARR